MDNSKKPVSYEELMLANTVSIDCSRYSVHRAVQALRLNDLTASAVLFVVEEVYATCCRSSQQDILSLTA